MANLVSYTISNVTRGGIVGGKADINFALDFTDKSVTYPDGSVADWVHHCDNILAKQVDVSGGMAAATANLEAWIEATIIPDLRARRAAEWAKLGTIAVSGMVTVNKSV